MLSSGWDSEASLLIEQLESMSMIDFSQRPQRQPSQPHSSYSQQPSSTQLVLGDMASRFGELESNESSRSNASDEGTVLGPSDFLLGTGSIDLLMGRHVGQRSGALSSLGPNRDRSQGQGGSRQSSRSASREQQQGESSMPSTSDARPGSPRHQSREKQQQQQQRGQGYRKLWQQVTKVGRGQKLGDNLSPEVTVRRQSSCLLLTPPA